MSIELVATRDLPVSPRDREKKFSVAGFAAEVGNAIENAKKTFARKKKR